MKSECLEVLRETTVELLSSLRIHPPGLAPQVRYRRTDRGGQADVVHQPALYALPATHREVVGQLSERLEVALKANYPEHMRRVGLESVSGPLQTFMILSKLAQETWKRFSTFDLADDQLAVLLSDSAGFFDKSTVRLRVLAPVLNVRGSRDVPPIRFPSGFVMRPMTDEELSGVYGGDLPPQAHGLPYIFPEFALVRDIEVEKLVDGQFNDQGIDPIHAPAISALDRSMLALSSFKHSGPVGYDGIKVEALELTFGIGFGGQRIWTNEHTPHGNYPIAAEEVPLLSAHAAKFENIHPSLEMACQRLIDALRRTKPRDAILDSIIGLESILLNEIGEKQRGENRFRFSLNYASLAPREQRQRSFRLARDLYDLRSTIAHGSAPKEIQNVGGVDMALFKVAAEARQMLHETVAHFMANPSAPDFIQHGYWTNKVLGL